MPLVDVGYFLTVTLADNGGNKITKKYQLRALNSIQANLDAPIVVGLLDAVTNSLITDWSLSHRFSEDTFVYPPAGIENEDKASVTVQLTGAGNGKANFKIPAPVIGIFQNAIGPGANIVDVTDVALQAYSATFSAAGECYISDGEDMLFMDSGKRVSAKNNNG